MLAVGVPLLAGKWLSTSARNDGLQAKLRPIILMSRGLDRRDAMHIQENRSTKDVLDDHLRESRSGAVEADLQRNYAEDLVVLTREGVCRGHGGLRRLADRLRKELPDSEFEYHALVVDGEIAFLEWSGRGGTAYVDDGVDTYVVRDGRIVAQSIHYTVKFSDERLV
jgi:hypothetical protein